jgi:hypothetical protein
VEAAQVSTQGCASALASIAGDLARAVLISGFRQTLLIAHSIKNAYCFEKFLFMTPTLQI